MTEKKIAHPRENKISMFFRETVGELRKVNWPTRREALNLTGIVLIVIFATSFFLGALDYLYTYLFRFLLKG